MCFEDDEGGDRLAEIAALTANDREFHEITARIGERNPELSLALLDGRYHDSLPDGQNCRLCGVEHSAIWPN